MEQRYQGGPVNNQFADPYFAKDFFVYELDFSSLAAAGSSTQSFTVQADSDFLWTKAAVFADVAGAAQTSGAKIVPLVTCLIMDNGSARNLMSSGVPLPSLFGSGELPMILPRQRLFLSLSQVSVTLTNFSAATTYNVRLSFIGEKAFRRG